MDLAAVFQGLADAAKAIPGLNCYGYAPDSVAEPAFYPVDADIDLDQAMRRGLDRMTVTCHLVMSRADDKSGYLAVLAYMDGAGTKSLKAALEAARNPGVGALGGACDDLQVTRIRGPLHVQVAGQELLGAEFTVLVIGSGS